MISLSSVELNFLVFRYLEESGLTHSAFALRYEAGLSNCPIDGNKVPPGALIKFIQKGLQYLEMEANLSNNETDLDEDFSFIEPLDLITKDVNELRQMINDRKKTQCKHADKVISRQHDGNFGGVAEKQNQDKKNEQENNRKVRRVSHKKQGGGKVHKRSVDKITTDEHRVKQQEDHTDIEMVSAQEDKASVEDKENEISEGKLRSTLSKHTDEIFSIKWNKKGDYILTGSLDTTAIVWDVKTNRVKQRFEFHSGAPLDTDWRNNVSFATSTNRMIHVCKIGTDSPIKTFCGHQSEINSVKWDPTGSLLASSSDDTTAKIWSLKLDKYVHVFKDHTKGIYNIRWSPTGQGTSNPNKQLLLASASFDSTVKTWDVEVGKLLLDLKGHSLANNKRFSILEAVHLRSSFAGKQFADKKFSNLARLKKDKGDG